MQAFQFGACTADRPPDSIYLCPVTTAGDSEQPTDTRTTSATATTADRRTTATTDSIPSSSSIYVSKAGQFVVA